MALLQAADSLWLRCHCPCLVSNDSPVTTMLLTFAALARSMTSCRSCSSKVCSRGCFTAAAKGADVESQAGMGSCVEAARELLRPHKLMCMALRLCIQSSTCLFKGAIHKVAAYVYQAARRRAREHDGLDQIAL